jgi:1-acyl-sn-glycerol-3-phosphate acyltransferase
VIVGISPDLPHTADLPLPSELGLRMIKPVVAVGLRRYWRIFVHGEDYVPPVGPAILAANHIGLLDGPVLVAMTRRLTFAMAKHELFNGLLGRLLAQVGQISVNRRVVDTKAITRAVQVLRAGRVLAVFPEGSRTGGEVAWARGGAAYLAMVTGAPIVPVALLGTREPGQARDQLPRRGAPIHVVYGPPFPIPRTGWPRRKSVVSEWTALLRERLAVHVASAQAETGLALPGPPQRVS